MVSAGEDSRLYTIAGVDLRQDITATCVFTVGRLMNNRSAIPDWTNTKCAISVGTHAHDRSVHPVPGRYMPAVMVQCLRRRGDGEGSLDQSAHLPSHSFNRSVRCGRLRDHALPWSHGANPGE